jgi:hypothetical protein
MTADRVGQKNRNGQIKQLRFFFTIFSTSVHIQNDQQHLATQ